MILKLVICLLLMCVRSSVGQQLRCYTCSFSSSDSDRSCLTITDTTASVNCPFTYCTIVRQEYVDPPGEVATFIRGCEQAPDFLNHDVSDSTFRTYYRACTNDLCNIGDGIEQVVGGNLSPTPDYNGINLLVPGTKVSASISNQANVLLLSLCFVIYYYVTCN